MYFLKKILKVKMHILKIKKKTKFIYKNYKKEHTKLFQTFMSNILKLKLLKILIKLRKIL